MGHGYSLEHAAALVSQLAPDSRVSAAVNPDNGWSDIEYMLASIEFSLRVLIWQNSKDGSKGVNKPKPLDTPGESARKRARSENFDKAFVDGVLGRRD